MDPVTNPFAPGAGTQPPELAGRDALLETVRIATERTKLCLPTKSVLMVGLRGVGKTVLLDKMRDNAESAGVHTVRIEAKEKRSLPAILAPELRKALLRLSLLEKSKASAIRAMKFLASFVKLKTKFHDIEVQMDLNPEPGHADSGDLEVDLADLMEASGAAAKSADTALILFVDELQYVREAELASLIASLHRMAQLRVPVMLIGAGLPQLRGLTGNAKSYAERLFDFPEVGPLSRTAAIDALRKPLSANGVSIESDAMERLVEQTQCYPYFIQEWGMQTWNAATGPLIHRIDVENASIAATASLDSSFFLVRFDRLTPLEKRFMRAMAELGPGPHRSGDIADKLQRKITNLSPTRSALISKGMIWAPNYGETAFTVPMFDEFMRRIMPGDDWKTA
jgi:hypothetical protein